MGLRDPDPPYEVARAGRDYPDTRVDGSSATPGSIQAVPDTFSSGGQRVGQDYDAPDYIGILRFLDQKSTDIDRLDPARNLVIRILNECISYLVR